MQRCAIECYAVLTSNHVNAQATSQCRCTTHGWMFVTGELMHDGKLCPIGMIEQATVDAIARVEEAKRK